MGICMSIKMNSKGVFGGQALPFLCSCLFVFCVLCVVMGDSGDGGSAGEDGFEDVIWTVEKIFEFAGNGIGFKITGESGSLGRSGGEAEGRDAELVTKLERTEGKGNGDVVKETWEDFGEGEGEGVGVTKGELAGLRAYC